MLVRRRLLASLAGTALLAGCTGDSASDPESETGCGPTTATIESTDVQPLPDPPEPVLPVTVDSADGREVTVTDASRVLPVNQRGSIAEIVFTLGLGERVIGRDTATTFPSAADLPLVTPAGHDLSAEGVLTLNPSVVLTDATIGPPEVLDQLRRSGIPVVFIEAESSLPAVPRQIRQVAAALGVPEAGERLVERVATAIAQATPDDRPGPPLRIAFLYVRGTAGVYLLAGDGSGADAMIEAIGAEDAGTAIGLTDFRPLTSEGMINAAPDVLLVMTKGLASVGGVDGLLGLAGVAQTPAGKQRRIVDMADGVLLAFGPRTGEAVAALAEAVYQSPCG